MRKKTIPISLKTGYRSDPLEVLDNVDLPDPSEVHGILDSVNPLEPLEALDSVDLPDPLEDHEVLDIVSPEDPLEVHEAFYFEDWVISDFDVSYSS